MIIHGMKVLLPGLTGQRILEILWQRILLHQKTWNEFEFNTDGVSIVEDALGGICPSIYMHPMCLFLQKKILLLLMLQSLIPGLIMSPLQLPVVVKYPEVLM